MSGEQVRGAIVSVVIAMVAESGFEALSVRSVAARADLSPGAVQHHFPTKASMLDAAMSAISDGARQRYETLASVDDPQERLHALADKLVPGTAQSTVAKVWLAFACRASVDATIRTRYAELWGGVRSGIRLLLPAAGGRPDTAEDDAAELLALLDGLALSVVAEQGRIDPDTARRIAHRRVTQLVEAPN